MQEDANKRLNSWKEIAAYLGCRERSARRWEKERALPVYRPPGEKRSGVYAFPEELDNWVRGKPKVKSVPGSSNTPKPQPTRRAVLAGMAAAGLTVGAGALWIVRRERRNPARAAAAGNSVRAWDQLGRLLWEHSFPEPLVEKYDAGSLGLPERRVQIADLLGDGRKHVLLATSFREPEATGGRNREELYCFTPEGKVLWRYSPNVEIRLGDTGFQGPWRLTDLIVSAGGGQKTIWVAAAHWKWRPSFVVKIDAAGKPALHFVQAGHIYCLCHVDGGSGSCLLAGGVNNEYASAAVAVLREDAPPACSPQSRGSRFECIDGPRGVPDRYFLLPPCEFAHFEVPYNRVWRIRRVARRAFVETVEGGEASAIYEFGDTLEPTSVAYNDVYAQCHRRFEEEGRLKHTLADCPQLRDPGQVRRWDPASGWQTVQVPLAKGVRPDG